MATPNATVTKKNILAGPGQLWWGIFGTAVIPAKTLITADPGVTFTDAGATDDGLTLTVNQNWFKGRVDQAPDAVLSRLTERDVMVSTNMAEGTLENLAMALNHDPTTAITADAGPPATHSLELDAGQDAFRPIELVIIVDGWAPAETTGRKRRMIVRRVNSTGNVSAAYKKDGIWLIPVEFSALFVDSVTSPIRVDDEDDA